jgi:hypothetical protein
LRGNTYRFYVAFPSGKPASTNALPANIISSHYETSSYADVVEHTGNMKIALGKDNSGNPYLIVNNDSYTDNVAFKTAMSGVYLVYELATETTESADPYINPQRSEGTEEFIDGLTRDVMVPVGNVTQYYQSEIIPIISEYIDAVMASN